MIDYLLKLLLAFFRLGVDGDEDEADPPEEASGEEDAEDTGEKDDDVYEFVEPSGEVVTKKDERKASIDEANRRAKAAEDIADAERAARRALESQARPLQTQQVDPLYQQEEDEYRQAVAAGDQDLAQRIQWRNNTNRTLRHNERLAQAAAFRSEDMADKADFRDLREEDPKMYARWKDKVEQELQNLRAKGQNLQRRVLYDYLVGKWQREARASGKLKTRTKAASKETLPGNVTRIDRGKPLNARSDVSSKQRMTDHQKREARLAEMKL